MKAEPGAPARWFQAAFVNMPTVLFGVVSAALLMRFKLNSTWLVIGGAFGGWFVHVVGLSHGSLP